MKECNCVDCKVRRNSTTPHKHAALIKAWADGAEVEVHYPQWPLHTWAPERNPSWAIMNEYRIKPTTIKYRNALMSGNSGMWVNSAMSLDDESAICCGSRFIKWLGDWQEVEI